MKRKLTKFKWIRLKEWLTDLGLARGVSYEEAYRLVFYAKKVKCPPLRRVNSRVIEVRIKR